jgi:translation initiation factor 2 subunit 2
MIMEYSEMLKRARKNLPEVSREERFEIPRAEVMPGKHTVIRNFSEIAKKFRREPRHIAKFLFRGLAVPGNLTSSELILQGNIQPHIINQRILEYVKEFVLCNECGKPDTNMQKTDKILTLKCEACGARRSLRDI